MEAFWGMMVVRKEAIAMKKFFKRILCAVLKVVFIGAATLVVVPRVKERFFG